MATRTAPDRLRRGLLAALLLTGTLLAGAGPAAQAGPQIPWNSLSKDEQAVLRKHQRDWSDMDGQEQERLRKGARKYLDLPQNKREAVERKRDQYRQMSPDERERLRRKYQKEKR